MANAKMKKYGGIADTVNGVGGAIGGLGGIATGVTGIISATATKEANDAQIEQTKQDATLEILKKMQQRPFWEEYHFYYQVKAHYLFLEHKQNNG